MTATVGYARFGSGCTRGHYARIIIPRRTVSILLGRVVIAMRTICRYHTTISEYRRNTVINRIAVGIFSGCPCSARRFRGCTIARSGRADTVIYHILVSILTRGICLTSPRFRGCTVTGTGRADAIVTRYTALSAGRICLTSPRFGAGYRTARCTIARNLGAAAVLVQRVVANREDTGVLRTCCRSACTARGSIARYVCCRTILLA